MRTLTCERAVGAVLYVVSHTRHILGLWPFGEARRAVAGCEGRHHPVAEGVGDCSCPANVVVATPPHSFSRPHRGRLVLVKVDMRVNGQCAFVSPSGDCVAPSESAAHSRGKRQMGCLVFALCLCAMRSPAGRQTWGMPPPCRRSPSRWFPPEDRLCSNFVPTLLRFRSDVAQMLLHLCFNIGQMLFQFRSNCAIMLFLWCCDVAPMLSQYSLVVPFLLRGCCDVVPICSDFVQMSSQDCCNVVPMLVRSTP